MYRSRSYPPATWSGCNATGRVGVGGVEVDVGGEGEGEGVGVHVSGVRVRWCSSSRSRLNHPTDCLCQRIQDKCINYGVVVIW